MVLISCPECERKVSDRAKACPDCGLPVAEVVKETQAKEAAAAARATRKHIGDVDCPTCAARGFKMVEMEDGGEGFTWCIECERTGRCLLFEASDGFFAVSLEQRDAFAKGVVDAGVEGVTHVGTTKPSGFRYDKPGKRFSKGEFVEEDDSSNEPEPD